MHPLKLYREARDLSLDDVRAATNISKASLSRIENWKTFPSSTTLLKLCSFSGGRLTANDFFARPPGAAGQVSA